MFFSRQQLLTDPTRRHWEPEHPNGKLIKWSDDLSEGKYDPGEGESGSSQGDRDSREGESDSTEGERELKGLDYSLN